MNNAVCPTLRIPEVLFPRFANTHRYVSLSRNCPVPEMLFLRIATKVPKSRTTEKTRHQAPEDELYRQICATSGSSAQSVGRRGIASCEAQTVWDLQCFSTATFLSVKVPYTLEYKVPRKSLAFQNIMSAILAAPFRIPKIRWQIHN